LDLHLTGDQPTPEEKAAIDLELGGAPESVWEGGAPVEETDTWSGTGGNHKAKSQRHLLLPVLHAIQNRIGWISHGAMNYTALRLDIPPAEVYGVASLYGMFSLQPRTAVVAQVCDDIA
jgi:NADH-quinone oxidoreductase subunit F